ncbi:MAG TPA: pyrroline-5-carboxylate reductase [Alphaproteobacteria bacterium]|nr:pyrroline-5-carboxylate reductase [Alphaproteobacteria bacterium]
MNERLLLVGGGKMGGAMLAGWLARGLPSSQVVVVEPGPGAAALRATHGVAVHGSPDEVAEGFRPNVVVFAVKPQMMDGAAPRYARYAGPDTVFLSIAAGKTIAYFRRQLGEQAVIVRAMPNTPAAVGRGMSVCCAGPGVSAAQRGQCAALLEAVGDVAWVEDEALLDPVTAVSGGGPAYVFLLVECLAEAGVAAGLPPALAMQIARATVAGSGELLRQSPEPAAVLRQNVTSPAGTTLEALKILMAENGLQSLLTKAIAAATRRSRELAG